MKLVVLVGNPLAQKPTYTTSCLAYEAHRRGHTVGLVGADDLLLDEYGHVLGAARTLSTHPPLNDRDTYFSALLNADREWWDLGACDVVLLRLLARPKGLDEDDGSYQAFYRARLETTLAFAQRLCDHTPALVLNNPLGLWRSSGKLFLAELAPGVGPKMLVARDIDRLKAFIAAHPNGAVLKTLLGHGGEDVFRVTAEDPNLNQIITTLLHEGYVVAQELLPRAEDGERRMLLMNGTPLVGPNGAVAVYARRQPKGEWRGNVHLGAKTEASTLRESDQRIVDALAPKLREWGLYLVGLDLIGDRLLEVNAFCPGGIDMIKRLTGFDAAVPIMDDLERRKP